jgi:hypothetical protein
LTSYEELMKRVKVNFLKGSRRMTRKLKKALIEKTIQDIEALRDGGDVYIAARIASQK